MAPELKLLHGMRPDRINARAPIPSEGVPTPPRSLSPAQKVVFRRITAELERMRVRCGPDVLIIEQLAVMTDWNRRARVEMESHGAWGSTAYGGTSTTGPWRVYRDSEREIARLSSELGLTPVSRNRVVTGPEESMDELEALLTQ